jgi:putative sterol carrier protein
MADPTTTFFEGLAVRGSEPLLGKVKGTVRFDIASGSKTDHWLVGITDGVLDVTHADGEADCVLRADKASFDKVASGGINPMAALLRGAVTGEGDSRLMVRVQRLFPPPTGMPEVAGDRAVGKRRS